LPGGSEKEMKKSLQKLLKLPEETLVLPGHGEKTTIGREKKVLLCPNNQILGLSKS